MLLCIFTIHLCSSDVERRLSKSALESDHCFILCCTAQQQPKVFSCSALVTICSLLLTYHSSSTNRYFIYHLFSSLQISCGGSGTCTYRYSVGLYTYRCLQFFEFRTFKAWNFGFISSVVVFHKCSHQVSNMGMVIRINECLLQNNILYKVNQGLHLDEKTVYRELTQTKSNFLIQES